MREFKFTNENDEITIEGVETVSETSFKKAVKSIQSKIKDEWVIAEYISKRGKEIRRFVKLLIGRKYRQAILQEKRREEQKITKGLDNGNYCEFQNCGHEQHDGTWKSLTMVMV